MSQFRCVVQHDSSADTRRDELETRLLALHEATHDDTPTFSWHAVPAGYMFTEGEQSTSSVVACLLDTTTTLPERERYMRGVCDIWTEVTGCTDHEVVVSVTELPTPEPSTTPET